MSYRALPQVTESAVELRHLLSTERDDARRLRLHLLLLIKEGRASSQAQAAEHLARHRNTISDWLGRYRSGGLEALLKAKTGGHPPGQTILPPAVFEALKARLDTDHGFSGYVDVQRWLARDYGLKLPYSSVHALVRYRLKAKLKAARPEHPKKA